MRKISLGMMVAVVCLVFAAQASAYVVYSDEAAFDQAVAGLSSFTEGFEEGDWGQSTVINQGITWEGFLSGAPADLVAASTPDGLARTGENGMYVLGSANSEAVKGASGSPLQALGFWIRPHANVTSLGADGFTVDLVSGDSQELTDGWQFFGIVAGQGESFTSFTVTAFGDSNGENMWFDDFTFVTGSTASPVPVPAAVWLLGSGLLSVLGVRSRMEKRRNA